MEDNKDNSSPGDDAKPFNSVCRAKKTFQINRKLMQWWLKCAALLFLAVSFGVATFWNWESGVWLSPDELITVIKLS